MSQAPQPDSNKAPLACGAVELVEQSSAVLKQAGIFSDPHLEHAKGAAASTVHGEANQVPIVPHHAHAAKISRTLEAFPRYEPDRLRAVPRFCFNEIELIPAGSRDGGYSDVITGGPMLPTESAAAYLKWALFHVSNLKGTRLNALRETWWLPLWQNQIASS